eukprot:761114-Hanusia_phi.AAC.1
MGGYGGVSKGWCQIGNAMGGVSETKRIGFNTSSDSYHDPFPGRVRLRRCNPVAIGLPLKPPHPPETRSDGRYGVDRNEWM